MALHHTHNLTGICQQDTEKVDIYPLINVHQNSNISNITFTFRKSCKLFLPNKSFHLVFVSFYQQSEMNCRIYVWFLFYKYPLPHSQHHKAFRYAPDQTRLSIISSSLTACTRKCVHLHIELYHSIASIHQLTWVNPNAIRIFSCSSSQADCHHGLKKSKELLLFW